MFLFFKSCCLCSVLTFLETNFMLNTHWVRRRVPWITQFLSYCRVRMCEWALLFPPNLSHAVLCYFLSCLTELYRSSSVTKKCVIGRELKYMSTGNKENLSKVGRLQYRRKLIFWDTNEKIKVYFIWKKSLKMMKRMFLQNNSHHLRLFLTICGIFN